MAILLPFWSSADRAKVLEAAEELLLERYGDGRTFLGQPRPCDARGARGRRQLRRARGPGPPEVPARHVLAALTQLDEARIALDTLERDLTRAARKRGVSWKAAAK